MIVKAIKVCIRLLDMILGRISWWCFLAAAIIGLLMVGCNAYEVTARYVFNRPTGFFDEVLIYQNIGLYFLVLAWGWRTKSHINVEVLLDQLSPRMRNGFSFFSICVEFMALLTLTCAIWLYEINLFTTFRRPDSPLRTPWFIPFAIVALGASIFFLEVMLSLGKRLFQLRKLDTNHMIDRQV